MGFVSARKAKCPYSHENHSVCHRRGHSFPVLLSSSRLITSDGEEACFFFSYCIQGGTLVEVENLTKLGEITGISAICVFSLPSTLSLSFFVMTNFQYSWIVLDSGKCLDPCLCSLVQYVWLHRDTIVESYIGQNRTEQLLWWVSGEAAGFAGGGMFLPMINNLPNHPANWQYANMLNVRWGEGWLGCQDLKCLRSISLSCTDTHQWFSLACWRSCRQMALITFLNGWGLSGNEAVFHVEALSSPWKRIGPSIDWRETCQRLRLCIIYTSCPQQLSWMSSCLDWMASNVGRQSIKPNRKPVMDQTCLSSG